LPVEDLKKPIRCILRRNAPPANPGLPAGTPENGGAGEQTKEYYYN
jgi:hypothetical protein